MPENDKSHDADEEFLAHRLGIDVVSGVAAIAVQSIVLTCVSQPHFKRISPRVWRWIHEEHARYSEWQILQVGMWTIQPRTGRLTAVACLRTDDQPRCCKATQGLTVRASAARVAAILVSRHTGRNHGQGHCYPG